jgi:hypothetical protein
VLASVGIVFIVALGLRCALGVWGPQHINGQGPSWIMAAADAARPARYGPGW